MGNPTRSNCGTCHWSGGGGDAVKHGDLDGTLKDPPASHDVHMGGLGFTCQECHQTDKHKIAGQCFSCGVSEGRVSCLDCHDERPHLDEHPLLKKLNDHGDTIACQTCHIPRFAKGKPTMMFWDWSKAGREMKVSKEEPGCFPTHSKKKGLLIKGQNVQPVYEWCKEKHLHYMLGDPADLDGITYINFPAGDIKDKNARITPYKVHTAIQPADAEYGYLIIPKLFGGYWKHFDWDMSAREGMKEAGLKYSGKIKFVTTRMYWRLNHEVVPKNNALSCTNCHSPDGVMDFKALGYAGDPAIIGGRFSTRPTIIQNR